MISVIIPVYNSGELLKRLINSLLQQTYRDLEILLINDGSTDNTEQICKEIIEKDSRFQYFYQKNAGVSAARNYGIIKSRGEYIAFLDADDEIDNNYFEELLSVCRYADIAICDVRLEDTTGKLISKFTLPNQVLTSEEALNYLLKRQHINSGPCAKLFKYSFIKQLRFPDLKVYEDILFVMKAFANSHTIGITDNTAYHYYQNEQSAMHNAVQSPSMDIVIVTDEIMKFIIKRKFLEDQCVYIALSHLYQYVQLSVNMCKKNDQFLSVAQRLYRKYLRQLLFCKSFPNKEKIIYIFFAFGWMYQHKQFIRMR